MIAETLASFFMSGGEMPKAQVASKVAIALEAWYRQRTICKFRDGDSTYLQHLDERNAQVHVGDIAADQAEAEEQTNRQDSSRVRLTVHRHFVSGVQNSSELGQTLRDHSSECHVPCRQE